MNDFRVLIRSAAGEKFFECFKNILKNVEKNCVDLLGKPIRFSNHEPHIADKQSLLRSQDYAIATIRMEATEEFSGNIYFCMSLCDAITFGSILLMIGDERLEEKRKLLNYTQEEEDAFKEVANVMASAFDETLRGLVKKKIHIKLAEVQHNEPDEFAKEDNKFFGSEKYIIITFSSKILDFKKSTIILAVEKPLAEAIIEGSLEGESETQQPASATSTATQPAPPKEEQPSTPIPSVVTEVNGAVVIVCDNNIEDLSTIEDVIANMNKKILKVVELKEADKYVKDANISAIILGMSSESNTALDYCKKLRLFPKLKKTPILLCVTNPTKDLVYKAVNAGISDIIVKPFDKETLTKKFKSHFN